MGVRARRRRRASLAALSQNEAVHALVAGIVERVNADHSRFEQIKKFMILPRDFTMADGEVTPTLKLKRRACHEHFADEIEALYTGLTVVTPTG